MFDYIYSIYIYTASAEVFQSAALEIDLDIKMNNRRSPESQRYLCDSYTAV
jgi:hypothetical protein